jgi:hypothetical protein
MILNDEDKISAISGKNFLSICAPQIFADELVRCLEIRTISREKIEEISTTLT